MEKKIIVSKRFSRNAQGVYEYLLEEYTAKAAYYFLNKLQQRIEFICLHPEVGKPSHKKASIRSISLQPHNRIYYRLTPDAIELLCLYDMRRKSKPY